MANYESNSPTSQPSLFSQVSGVPAQPLTASVSNLSGEGSHAGISSPVVRLSNETTEAVAGKHQPRLVPATTDPLPDITRNRHKGNLQSEAANVRVHPIKSELKTKILNFLRERVGSTTEEVATGLNLRYTTASGRISELRRDSALEDSGKTRPTSSGCAATVWTTKGTNA